ncbi:hypothetical protein BX616_003860 [Lobosporangium transversale]|uniref:Uncharacterized protein n=1 Tax=Lobosporangium transversale TaxID=64571 RepID=A0A1Y2G5G3_9FUNG|nr:hypothetical protein BCR41DRAFT_390845 [Lobosporangium transversale]KAF9898569.1 hypothetical protein BX616_003860 [Lobosporangium transversale]ORY95133.1 hypothetical protein BCR41DRAFT_390845 [Lobosporangium transversale]|eukprot:XP_021875340.1 hypothetical protein BCR41DRAFT_390845 [Lobosporangium transversale]
MTTVIASPKPVSVSGPRVKVERKTSMSSSSSSTRNASTSPSASASTSASASASDSATSPKLASRLPSNQRFSNIQSKVGSLEQIHYKPKPSEKKIQSFGKQDFSHIKPKVDAKLALPTSIPVDSGTSAGETHDNDTLAPAPTKSSISSRRASASASTTVPKLPPFVVTTGLKSTRATANEQQKPLSPTARPSTATIVTATATATTGATTSIVSAGGVTPKPLSPNNSRRSSAPAGSSVASPPKSPTSPTRRISKHIIPTQKLVYDHVKSKVGSFDNIDYKRGRAASQTSAGSADENDPNYNNSTRSRSPSARSSTSSNGTSSTSPTTTTASRRSSFKISPPKKVDYSKVKSKVNSLEYINHTPQGGNLRIFSEKLAFREQAQSKIAKEINSVQIHDYSRENSIQEEHEHAEMDHNSVEQEHAQNQDGSIIYSSDMEHEEFEPPKNILSVLDEVVENVDGLELDGYQQQEQMFAQPNNAQGAQSEPVVVL